MILMSYWILPNSDFIVATNHRAWFTWIDYKEGEGKVEEKPHKNTNEWSRIHAILLAFPSLSYFK